MLNGQEFKAVGPNIYWLGLDESYTRPSQKRIEEMFSVSNKMASTVIRSHTIGHSSGSSQSLLENLNNMSAWAPIDFSFVLAAKYNIKLICPLTDNYWWYNGNYGDFTAKRGLSKKQFWTDRNVINDFKNYISAWLNHKNQYTGIQIKNDPGLFLIELGNELGNIRNNDNSVPPKAWLEEISGYIKSLDSNHLVLDGADESLGQSGDFSVQSLDAFSSHFYGEDFSRLDRDAAAARNVGKPYLTGEYSPFFSGQWFNHIVNNKNISGAVFWSLYGNDDSGVPIQHDDGYTVHYDDPKDAGAILQITNLHRRMRGLPLVNQLPEL
jgi:mannan endo-1,4-beta-mannosidase